MRMRNFVILAMFVTATVALTQARRPGFARRVVSIVEVDGGPARHVELASGYTTNAIVEINRVGDDAVRTAGFTLAEPTTVRVIAMGEGMGGEMYDYGWIVDASNHRRVWSMEYRGTSNAGGAQKNRVSDETLTLPAGSYIAYYVTDGSHSFNDWNSSPPPQDYLWGMTILRATEGNAQPVAHFDPADSPNVVAQIARVGDGQTRTAPFTLGRETTLNVYALGEGSGGNMFDFGEIRTARGRQVWRMTYDQTEWAGGARKNRVANTQVTLPAGEYTLNYRSDGSHSFGDWNDAPPYDPLNWGITLSVAN